MHRQLEQRNRLITVLARYPTVARGYGWKEMVRRFKFPNPAAAVEKVEYPGLDLANLRWTSFGGGSGGAAAT
jgi:hypothetical protein